MCWLPIAPGLAPHGLRHTHKTLMREAGIPPKLMDERMGHEDGSVQSRYDHITLGMRRALMAALTGMWEEALDVPPGDEPRVARGRPGRPAEGPRVGARPGDGFQDLLQAPQEHGAWSVYGPPAAA
jgi:hypothetical protein